MISQYKQCKASCHEANGCYGMEQHSMDKRNNSIEYTNNEDYALLPPKKERALFTAAATASRLRSISDTCSSWSPLVTAPDDGDDWAGAA
jgi:hypothetical protein